MSEGSASLLFAVRLPVVAKYLGQLGIMLALLNLVPLLVTIVYQEWAIAASQVVVLVLILLLSIPTLRIPTPQKLQENEALVIVGGAFLLTPLLACMPFMAAGLSFDVALFEAVSAITTTGLTLLQRPEELPPSFLFSRAWMQWYGGLGIVVLSVALLMGHHVTARRLAEPQESEGLVSTARTHARRMVMIYVLMTCLAIAVVIPLVGDGMLAIDFVLAAVSTGGFAPHQHSLALLPDWTARGVVLVLGLCGAIPLYHYYRVLHGGLREVLRDGEIWLLLMLCIFITAMVYLLTPGEQPDKLLHSAALVVSAQSTAGFSTAGIAQLAPAVKVVLMTAMFVGGGVGSTAGGIKLLRTIMFFKLMQLYLRRSAATEHSVLDARLGGRLLGYDELVRAQALIILYAAVVSVSWLLFVSYGYAPLDALFEVVSAVGTVGLSTGITSELLPGVLKAVLITDMLLGRLEIVALLVICYPPTWFGNRLESV